MRMASTMRRSAMGLMGLVSLAACGSDTPMMMTTDAGTTDSGMMMMMGTDSGPRPDAGPMGDPYERLSTAFDAYTMDFCECIAADPEAMTTVAECLEINADDPDIEACNMEGYTASRTSLRGYHTCRAAAAERFQTCYAAAACAEAAVMTCNATLQADNMACESMINEMGAADYNNGYQPCIVERVTGPEGTCPDDATMVSSATGMAVFMGTTAFAGADTDPAGTTCLAEADRGAPDRAFRWQAPAAGTYTIDTIGSSYDTVLYVRNTCADTADIACNDDITAGENRQSTVMITATAAMQEFVIIVDGWTLTERGNFVVNITPMM